MSTLYDCKPHPTPYPVSSEADKRSKLADQVNHRRLAYRQPLGSMFLGTGNHQVLATCKPASATASVGKLYKACRAELAETWCGFNQRTWNAGIGLLLFSWPSRFASLRARSIHSRTWTRFQLAEAHTLNVTFKVHIHFMCACIYYVYICMLRNT